MAFELIAAFVAGLGAAGLVMMLRRLTGNRLPRWLTPATAGLAMIGYGIWTEYAWFGRTTAALPDGVEIVSINRTPSVFRPWTYAAPFVDRFAAVDLAAAQRHDAAPGQVLVDVMLIARWGPRARVPVLVDCQGARRADLIDGAEFGADGRILDPDWRPLGGDDPLIATVCADVATAPPGEGAIPPGAS